jgi:hypothetical protein
MSLAFDACVMWRCRPSGFACNRCFRSKKETHE